MIDGATWERIGAGSRRLIGNEVVLLDGDSTLRFVESGSVALFGVDVKDGAPAGPRRLLQRVGSGQAVLSVPSGRHEGLRFVMVPIQESVIREVPLESLWKESFGSPRDRAELLDAWVDLVAGVLGPHAVPELPTRSAGGEVALADEQSLCPERAHVVWCEVREGSVLAMGAEEHAIGPDAGPFPLGAGMWVRAQGAARVSVRTTEQMDDAASVEAGFAHLHGMALDRLMALEQDETAQEVARLEERDRKQSEATERAMADLAAVLEPKAAGEVTVAGDPLLATMTAIGREVGIEIRPPAKSEDPKRRPDPLEAIARASRIRIRRVTLSGEWWKRDCGPLLAFSADDERRPLALLRDRKLRYYILDPAAGTRVRLTRRNAGGLAHEAVMLYRPLPDGKLKLSDLFKFSLGNRQRDLTVVVLTGVAATLLGMITPQAIALLMDQAIPDANRGFLLEIGAGLLAAAFGATTFQLSQGILLQRIGLGSEGDSQAALWDRLLRLRPSFFRQYSSGDLESRVMAVNEVGRELSGATLTTLFASFMAVLNLGLLYYYSPSLCLLAVAIATIVFVFTVGVSYFIRISLRELLELDGTFFGLVVQLINGVGKLRVAGAEGRAYTHWIRKYAQMLKLRNRIHGLSDSVYVFNVVLPAIGSMLLYYFAFELLISSRSGGDGISLGIFLAFNTAFATFLSGVAALSGTVVGFLDTMTKGRRIQPILDEEPEADVSKADPGRLTGRLEVEDVGFAYRADGPRILDGVSLRAEPGEFVAIVGASGSGKSTLFRLLLGFETQDVGTIGFDGQDLSNLDVIAVRRQLGVVLQGGKLDVGSIFDNIACGNVITLDEAWAAAEDAGMAAEIREMPMGMHTIISVGGGNLSGGQRQRLLIARALAHRPRILLFDEATSALDNRTQAIVSKSLERLRVTRIVIAHRLSTIRGADRIYVLEGGRVVQEGTFDQLIEKDGLFQRMMARQVA